MGTRLVLFLLFQTPPKLRLHSPNPLGIKKKRGQVLEARWLRNEGPTSTGRRFSFDQEDADRYWDGYGGSRWSSSKQRKWWYDDDDNEEEEDDFYGWEFEANEFPFFKVIRAFGWMLPAIAILILLGTGQNAFFMALAIPLGQTALSLVIDKVWGNVGSASRHRRKTKTRKKPFARDARETKRNDRKEESNDGEGIGSYQSWTASDDASNKKKDKKAQTFGGWDELDGVNHRAKPNQETNSPQPQQENGKLSRRGRVRDKPLILRLLIAVFPFMASWTNFIF